MFVGGRGRRGGEGRKGEKRRGRGNEEGREEEREGRKQMYMYRHVNCIMFACTQANRKRLQFRSPTPPTSSPLPLSPPPSPLSLLPLPSPFSPPQAMDEGLGPGLSYLDLLLCADDSKVWVMHVRSGYHVVLHLIWVRDGDPRVVEDEY